MANTVDFEGELVKLDVLNSLGRTEGEVTIEEMNNLFSISFRETFVVDELKCLQHCPNLTTLEFPTLTLIDDFSFLNHLRNLESLDFGDCNVTDITPLRKMTNLTCLNFYSDQVTDLSPLASLQNLEILEYTGTEEIKDLSPVSQLQKLEKLSIINCDATDISFLKGLYKLTHLNLSSNRITDISSLTRFTDIVDLDLSGNNISDISPLAGLQKLRKLDISSNVKILDLSPLKDLKNLYKLEVDTDILQVLPTPTENNTDIAYDDLLMVSIDPNLLSKKNRNLLYELVKNPCKKKALELLEQSPTTLIAGRNYFTKDELEEFFRNKFAQSDINEEYIRDFIDYECLDLVGVEQDEVQFIGDHGCNKARSYTVKYHLSKNKD